MSIDDAPHGLIWTHADQVNKELTSFLGATKMETPKMMAQ